MKKIFLSILAAILAMSATEMAAAPDLQELLNKLKNGQTTDGPNDSQDNNNSSTGSTLDALRGLGNALGIIPSKTVDADYLKGVWSYQKPAVAFKSDNFLAKAGGVAASAKVENELEPYYKRVGLDKMTLTFNADSTFVMQLSRGKLQGEITTIEDKENTRLMFKFKALGKLPVGSMEAFINAESGTVMALTFDVSKLMSIIQKVATFSGNNSLQTLSKLLEQYDGITAGFRMKKTANLSGSK